MYSACFDPRRAKMTAVVSNSFSKTESSPSADEDISAATNAPLAEYQRRRIEFAGHAQQLARVDRRLSLTRAALFVIGVGLLAWGFYSPIFAWWWCLLPVIGFAAAVVRHESVSRQLDRCRRGIAYHEQNLDRLEHRWPSAGTTGERYVDEQHPYECDLDLFGKGSLFQLLCRARTRLGEDVLAGWLRTAANPSAIDFRQRAINELRGRVDLRENLALLPAEVHDSLDQKLLHHWASQPPQSLSWRWLAAAGTFGIAAVVSGIGWMVLGWPLAILVFVAILELLLHFALKNSLLRVAHDMDKANSGLAILSQVLSVLEAEQFHTPLLAALVAQIDSEHHVPSWQIHRLQKLSAWLDSAWHNQLFAPLAFLLCLPIWLTHAIERWRATVGPHIEQWLDAVGQFEAISSLAGYAFEHPADPFPEIIAVEVGRWSDGLVRRDSNLPTSPPPVLPTSAPVFDAAGLGHPLIPVERCIRNDIRFGAEPRLVMVSGSNMSGKSTLLRTIGSNVVLALAGAPVRATRMRVSPFVLATSIRVHDSLLEGASLFFAVISRMKSIVERTGGPIPVLFLIDEILPGTNSHDRRVGAEGIIRRLLDRGAAGLVTTHDLALTDIVEKLGSIAVNVHFEDRLESGRMTFDYRIRPGVVRRSNALELMRLVGLGEMPDEG